MRRLLIILLAVVAVPLYVWNGYLIIRSYVGGGGGRAAASRTEIQQTPVTLAGFPIRTVTFTPKGKSPFLAYKEEPRPVIVKSAVPVAPPTPKEEVKPPNVSINGIMWNSTSPVAILNFPDGSSSVVKPGQKVGETTVKKIEQNRVLISYEGKEFWIGK